MMRAVAIAEMVESIVFDRRQVVLPAVVVSQGEYGQRNLAMEVPCILSDEGVERIIELLLNDQENEIFDQTFQNIRADLKRLA